MIKMEFKIGDRVKLVSLIGEEDRLYLNHLFQIEKISKEGYIYLKGFNKTFDVSSDRLWFGENQLESVGDIQLTIEE